VIQQDKVIPFVRLRPQDGEKSPSISRDSQNSGSRDLKKLSRSSFFIPSTESVERIRQRRQKSQERNSTISLSPVISSRPTSYALPVEESAQSASRSSFSSQTQETSEQSCIGEQLYETKIIETKGHQSFFHPVSKHFSIEFSTQMVLSVLATLHDVVEQITLNFVDVVDSSLDIMREDIDVCRLEECVNNLFETCLSRPYCQGSSSQSIYTFEANFKVWSLCLPLVLRCFARWSAVLPLRTKRWQEMFYHFLNLKNTKFEGLPAHDDIVRLLEDTLIRKYESQDLLTLSIQDVEDVTDEKSPSLNKVVKTNENGKQLLAATEEKIIDALVFRESDYGASFKEVFFCGFRNFITPMRLLCYLMGCVENVINDLFNQQLHSPTKSRRSATITATIPRVMNLLKYWITTYGSDWDERLVAAAYVLLERCSARAATIPLEHSTDEVGLAQASSEKNSTAFPKRVSSLRLSPIIEKNNYAEDKSSAQSSSAISVFQSNAASNPVASTFSVDALHESFDTLDVSQSAAFISSNPAIEEVSAFSIVGHSVSMGVSNLTTSQKNSYARLPATNVTNRSSNEFILSTFQVFVRALVKHLKSSGFSETKSRVSAFDSLPSKNVKMPVLSLQVSVFQFFRQNIDVGDLFLMHSPKHWAQCLTLHSFHIFRRIQAQEFFRQPFPAWQVKPDNLKKILVPNISANAEFFNLVKDFLVGCIFRVDNDSRKRVLVHIIEIAYCMKLMNNFDGMFSSVSALDSVGVFRLKRLWSSVSTPDIDLKLGELRFLMESRNKYANYTAALRSASPPKLPYIAHFLGSLFMHSERHPPKVGQHS
jgi:hypothetical protein